MKRVHQDQVTVYGSLENDDIMGIKAIAIYDMFSVLVYTIYETIKH